MSRFSYKTLILILLFLLIPIVLFLRISQNNKDVYAEWWDETWMYRQSINISSHTSDETDVYITATISIGSTAKAQADAGDFRFLNSTGQILPYYIVSGAGTTSITFHIALAAFDAGAQTLYAYYGNPSAENGFSASDFSPEASNYTLGSQGTEEVGGGPIGYWKFDEGVGTTTYESVNNFNGGLINGASWQNEDQCFSGKCVLYDGTNNYISVPNNSQLKFLGSNFTVSVWAKPVSKKSHVFVAKGQGTRRRGYQILTNSTNVLFLYSDTYDSGDHLLYGPTYNANEWMYLTLVVDKNLNQIEGFVNGVSTGTMDISTITEDVSENYPLEIGRNNAYYANSFIDEVKIFPYARTETQIKADYAAGLAGTSTSSDTSASFGTSSTKFLSDGLVGYWKFDEGVGTSAIDFSGNNFSAIMAGTLPTWSTGKYGVGLTFTDESYLNISSSTTFDFPSSDFSLSAWIKMTSSASLKTLFYKGNPYCDSCQGGYVLNVNSGVPRMTLDFNSTTGNMYTATSPTAVNDDKWHHLVGLRNGNKIEIYIDGNFSVATTFPAGSTFTDISGSYLSLSRNAWSFNGSVDEARIYNRALSASEIRQLADYSPSPVGYWKMDEGVGTTSYDSSTNNNNLAWNGTLGDQSDIGKFGKAAKFNGSNNSLSVGNTNSFDFSKSSFTINFWAKLDSKRGVSILSKSTNGYSNPGYRFYVNGSNMIEFAVMDGTTTVSVLPTMTNYLPVWTYYTGIWNSETKTAYLYANGTLISKNSNQSFTTPSSNYTFTLGNMSVGSYFLDGSLDEVKIYNYARTQKQILEDMNATSPVGGSSSKVADPIAYYKFDEGFGSTTANWGIGGTILNGTFGTGTSSPSWTNGKIGKALNFDGNDYIGIADDNAFNLEQNFSVSGWFKTSTTGVRTGIFYLPAGGYISVFVHSTNAFYFETRDNNNAYLGTSSGSYHDGQWHHFVATRDDNNDTLNIYIDGSLKSSASDTRTGSFNSTSGPFIGRDSSDFKFNGLIDEVKIYNYALSADEIKQDYNQGSSAVFGSTSQTIGATTTSLEYCVPGSTDHCAPPVGEWKFDEGVGTTAYDSSGNNYNGTFGTGSSAPSWSIGKFGKSLSFNSSQNQYVDLGNQKLVITGNITVNAWIKTNSSGTNRAIIAKYGNSGAYTWRLAMNTNGNITFNRGQTGTEAYNTIVTSNRVINDNQWHFVTATFDSNYMKLYIDGQFDNQVAETRTSDGLVNWEACIGDDGYTCGLAYGYGYWQGSIDQVRIYNYARTPAQIAYDYNRGEPVGWWKMDECQGTQIADWSGNANHGTLSIGASGTQTSAGTCTTSGAWYNGATGKINASLNLDGSDDIASIPNHTNYQFSTKDFTISTWIKPFEDINNYDTVFSKASCLNHYCYVNSLFSAYGELRWYFNDSSQTLWNNYLTFGANANFTNKWSHILATRQGTVLKGYLNGVLINTSSVPDNYNLSNSYSIEIGKEGSIGTYFPGQIDDVRIYNYALTATQVKTLYNNGSVNFR